MEQEEKSDVPPTQPSEAPVATAGAPEPRNGDLDTVHRSHSFRNRPSPNHGLMPMQSGGGTALGGVDTYGAINTFTSIRRAQEVGGLASLPIAASTQEAADFYPATVGRGQQLSTVPEGDEAMRSPAPTPTAAAPEQVEEVRVDVATGAEIRRIETGTMPEPEHPKKKAAKGPVAAKEYDADDHLLTLEQLARRYGTHIDVANPNKSQGLTVGEAERRLATYGKNQLSPPKQVPEIIKFLKQFTNLLMLMLLTASGLAFLAWGLNTEDESIIILAGALLVVVIATCTLNYFHERQAGNVLASIQGMLPSETAVVRDGKEMKVPAGDLVLGDLVHLTIGNRIPADIRLISVADLKVEMSSLTGESDAIECSVEKRSDHPAEARNLVFNSSLVMNGDARGIVVRTGDHTMIGSIAGLATQTSNTRSSLEIEVTHVVKFITLVAGVLGVCAFVIGLARGRGVITSIVYGLLLTLVANVPEGLPTTVVTVLTLTAQRMSERHVFIKRTDIIETLGAATVICSDKTGTLTQNRMTVENIWCNKTFSAAAKVRHAPAGAATTRRPVVDPAIGMTIGRQMSMMHDGTMVIHATQPTPTYSGSMKTAASQSQAAQRPGQRAGLASIFPTKPPEALEGGPDYEPGPVPESSGTAAAETKATPVVAPSPAVPISAKPSFARGASFQRQGSYRSFNSFQGMTQASWQRSNAFTRLTTVAAVCNRAQFGAIEDQPVAADSQPTQTTQTAPQAGSRPRRRRRDAAAASKVKVSGDPRPIYGDASEAALLRYCDSLIPIFEFRMAYPTLLEVPFNSINKWAAAVVRDPENHSNHIVMMKGAPERIIDRCSTYVYNGTERPIDDDFRTDWSAAYEKFGMMGERVLGFAYKEFPGRDPAVYKKDPNSYPTDDLVFVGMISLVDPPKEGVDGAIDDCRDAYVKVTMVTGDHPLTAEAIARKVGIITLPTAREVAAEDGVAEQDIPLSDPRVQAAVVPGSAIPSLSEEQWVTLLSKEEVVFARTSPQQKLQIVDHYQKMGHVVAVTGDGTNDSPALKKAQIGVSMGSAMASDVAREAADILLLDDNFVSIVGAIEMGRLCFDNLRKTIAYTLTHATPEVVPIFLDLAFGLPLALTGLLILTIDLITEQVPAASLAYEPSEASIMTRPPRNMKTDRMVDGRLLRYSYLIAGVLMTGVCLLTYFTIFLSYGVTGADLWNSSETFWQDDSPPLTLNNGDVLTAEQQVDIVNEAHAGYYLTLILCQVWNLFVCKTRFVSLFVHGPLRNHISAYGIFIAVFVGMFFIYVDALQGIFQTAYLGGYWFLPHFLFGFLIIMYTEYSKKKTRMNPDGWWARHMQW